MCLSMLPTLFSVSWRKEETKKVSVCHHHLCLVVMTTATVVMVMVVVILCGCILMMMVSTPSYGFLFLTHLLAHTLAHTYHIPRYHPVLAHPYLPYPSHLPFHPTSSIFTVVSVVPPNRVQHAIVSEAAYLLFYRKKQLTPSNLVNLSL